MYVSLYPSMHLPIYACMHACMLVCVCVCAQRYTCRHVCIHMRLHDTLIGSRETEMNICAIPFYVYITLSIHTYTHTYLYRTQLITDIIYKGTASKQRSFPAFLRASFKLSSLLTAAGAEICLRRRQAQRTYGPRTPAPKA